MWYNGGMTEKGIEVYKVIDGEVVFDVDKDEDTIWATQAQIAEVFGVDRTVVGRHLRNIFKSGELEEEVVCAKNAHTILACASFFVFLQPYDNSYNCIGLFQLPFLDKPTYCPQIQQ